MSSSSIHHQANGQNGVRPTSSNGAGERAFEHLQDLQAKAAGGYDPQSHIAQLVEVADRGLKQAQTLIEYRRPDLAFVEYLRALEIVLNVIPRHKEFAYFKVDHPEQAAKFTLLMKKINGLEEQYANIKEIIKRNNQRLGTRRRSSTGSRPLSSSSMNGTTNGVHAASQSPQKARPSPSPKPEKLHGRAVSHSDALNARFAQLRVDTNTITPASQSQFSSASSQRIAALPMPSSRDYVGAAVPTTYTSGSTRPQGPRDMPDGNDVSALGTPNGFGMPQEPKATYSPARNMQTAGNIAPPRHSARSLAGTSVRRQSSLVTSPSSPLIVSGAVRTQADAMNGNNGAQSNRHKAFYAPKESSLSAGKLFDYLERFNVLLIDFRPRSDFDQGHIFSRSVICIEPFSVRPGMSADELLESMVLSPDSEQDLFSQRDLFDLVVYYDEHTASDSYLTRPSNQQEQQLKCLHEALSDFNQDKPLQRMPSLLKGGLAAWVDLVGRQALMSSDTISRAKMARPVQRPSLSATHRDGSSQLRISKRRIREYNPLDEEEEQKWRERARAESVAIPQPSETTNSEERDADSGDESGMAIRDFLARFPDAGKLTDRHFFAGTMPERDAPEVPPKAPIYPVAPHPSEHPIVPTRPPPAKPRMSYNGVSDRSVSGTTHLSRSTSGTPYIPPKYLATNLRLPRTGLVNFGNTCYMNSTIQALSSTIPLSVFFLDDTFRSQIQRSNWRSNSKGVMAELYSNLIRSLWKGDVECIRPTTFRRFCGRASQVFESDGTQQDAKEFLDFLMDCLHEDLNLNWSRTPLRALTDAEEAKRERMPKLVVAKLEWERYIHRDMSFLQGLFGGQHLSKLTCQTCGFTSSKYEFFSSISVEIPSDPRKCTNGRYPTLEDCLRSYCTEETLSGEEAWVCPRCKVPRETSKRIIITRVPQTLIVHFKRFDNTGRTTRKFRVPVDFPLENLDLAPFVLPAPSKEEAQLIARDYGSEYLKTDESMTPPYSYDAYAVVRHIGTTMQSGHYITAVKDRARQRWRFLNDTRASDFDPKDLKGPQSLQNEEAYIVFYQRTQASTPGGKI